MKNHNDKIFITMDTDWAPEWVLEYVVGLIESNAINATLFVTHDSPAIKHINSDAVEIGLHPNFNNLDKISGEPIRKLKEIYPQAKGGRSHSLFISSIILSEYRKNGLVYESNNFLYKHPHLRVTDRFSDMVSIPFYWSDDKIIELNDPFSLDTFTLDAPGLKVMNFHPIHVYLNTVEYGDYERAKPHFKDREILETMRVKGRYGMGNLFLDLIGHVRSNNIQTGKLYELVPDHMK